MELKHMIYISLFIAIVAILGFFPPIPIPFIPVPITLQTLGVMLSGSILGAKRGSLAMFIFILIVATGAPLLSGGRGGLGVIFGPTGGYIFAFPVSAFLIGFMREKWFSTINVWKLTTVHIIFGVLLMNLSGATYLSFIGKTDWLATFIATFTFFPGDIIKAFLAALLSIKLINIYPELRQVS